MVQPNTVTFRPVDAVFEVTNAAVPMCKISISYPFSSSNYSADDVEVCLFSNALHAESQVFRAKLLDSTEQGWLFAAAATASKEHTQFENPHFRHAAFAATSHILKFLLASEFIEQHDGETLEVGEIVRENLSILVYTKIAATQAKLHAAHALYPFMLSIGFVPVELHSALAWQPGEFAEQRFRGLLNSVSISIKFRADPQAYEGFVRDLFGRRIQEASDPILKFYYFYQLIELLTEEIFRHSTCKLVDEMYRSKTELAKVHVLFEKMQEQKKDKARLNKLMNEFTRGTGDNMSELLRLCNAAIGSSSLEAETTVSYALYSVRNLIVHNLRNASPTFIDQLKTINSYLEVGIPDILNAFEIPSSC